MAQDKLVAYTSHLASLCVTINSTLAEEQLSLLEAVRWVGSLIGWSTAVKYVIQITVTQRPGCVEDQRKMIRLFLC